ncbi:MAG TPA: hypothetical protein VGB45_07640 [Abditibacterium sp.]
MRLVFRPFCLVFLCVFLANAANARPLWPIPPLSTFNGARWGDLVIGQTSFRAVQKSYETGKGDFERSTELTQPKNSPVRVDLLWNLRGKEEILGAIAVRFTGDGPKMSEIAGIFDPKSEFEVPFYWRGRYEDWRVAQFAPRGVAAFCMRYDQDESAPEFAPLLLLCEPRALQSVARTLSAEFAPVERRFDPHENKPKVMEFSGISVDIDLDDNLRLPWSERPRTFDQIAEADAEGTIRYYRNGSGTYAVKVTGDDNGKKGGSISATVTIAGNGPYGALRATASGYDGWSWTKKDQENGKFRDESLLRTKVRDSYREAVSEARRDAEAKFARAMLDSGPPPLPVVREGQWREIIGGVRNWNAENAIAVGILR